jgi:hypothetical protein
VTTETTPGIDFYILAWGLVTASVCTSLNRKDATARLNSQLPTGISSRWAISKEKTFATGEPMPHQCETFATHKHYLFHC